MEPKADITRRNLFFITFSEVDSDVYEAIFFGLTALLSSRQTGASKDNKRTSENSGEASFVEYSVSALAVAYVPVTVFAMTAVFRRL